MIVCPTCRFDNPMGSLFCDECGMQLIRPDGTTTALIEQSWQVPRPRSAKQPVRPPAAVPNHHAVTLHFVETGQVLPLTGNGRFVLGRPTPGLHDQPDIDLTPYGAYERGVSRLHAVLKVVPGQVSLTDLNSSNGTRINDQQLLPHKQYPLSNGDRVSLGKLELQAIIRE